MYFQTPVYITGSDHNLPWIPFRCNKVLQPAITSLQTRPQGTCSWYPPGAIDETSGNKVGKWQLLF